MTSGGMASAQHIPWHLLQDWVSQQLAYENEHSGPAPITAAQEKALLSLLRLLDPPRPPPPELGDTNWVGTLQEFLQGNGHMKLPDYQFADGPIQVPGTSPTWQATVTIPTTSKRFPGPAGGLGADGQCPSFSSKKDAKSYAAKCAYAYLTDRQPRPARPQPSSTNEVRPPVSEGRPVSSVSSPLRQPAATSSSASSPAVAAQTKSTLTEKRLQAAQIAATKKPPQQRPLSSSSYSASSVSSASPADRNDSCGGYFRPDSRSSSPVAAGPKSGPRESFVAKVAKLCQEYGIDSPEYKVQQTSVFGYYEGYPVFKSPTMSIPEGLGHVKDSLGKKETKERIAEEVYGFMFAEYNAHEAKVREFMAGLPPTSGSMH